MDKMYVGIENCVNGLIPSIIMLHLNVEYN